MDAQMETDILTVFRQWFLNADTDWLIETPEERAKISAAHMIAELKRLEMLRATK